MPELRRIQNYKTMAKFKKLPPVPSRHSSRLQQPACHVDRICCVCLPATRPDFLPSTDRQARPVSIMSGRGANPSSAAPLQTTSAAVATASKAVAAAAAPAAAPVPAARRTFIQVLEDPRGRCEIRCWCFCCVRALWWRLIGVFAQPSSTACRERRGWQCVHDHAGRQRFRYVYARVDVHARLTTQRP